MPAWVRYCLAVMALLVATLWWLSRPLLPGPGALPPHVPDRSNGERLFYAGGCASCHGERLAEGVELSTAFGIFRAPNITPDAEFGIGGWNQQDFINAMRHGVAPDGTHYYPAFPYTSYARISTEDLLDLKSYLDSLPPVARASPEHQLKFPYGVRRALGLWKRLYLSAEPVREIDASDRQVGRGRYLVEGAGHCGECHTPRNRWGALRSDRWLRGAPAAEGEGQVPDISADSGLAGWSAGDIAYYLESGIDPEFDVVGGSMVQVQENMARLPPGDRAAIAAYLKAQ